MFNRIKSLAYSIKLNWPKVYRYNGGALAAGRCLLGTVRLKAGILPKKITQAPSQVDVVTFSVVPRLTAIWAWHMARAIPRRPLRLLIGDCSGGFRPTSSLQVQPFVLPLLNLSHGEKLDLFMQKVCQAEIVIFSDDDIFLLNQAPFEWAMQQFDCDPKLAVVSLVPRLRFTWSLNGQEHPPMGSYCLLVRREMWLKEGLSFQQVLSPSPDPRSWKGQYDTADYANVELIRRGYRVVIAPPELRDENLVIFKGTSIAILSMQADPAALRFERLSYEKDVRGLKKHTYRKTCEIDELNEIAWQRSIFPEGDAIVPEEVLARYKSWALNGLSEGQIEFVEKWVSSRTDRMKASLGRD